HPRGQRLWRVPNLLRIPALHRSGSHRSAPRQSLWTGRRGGSTNVRTALGHPLCGRSPVTHVRPIRRFLHQLLEEQLLLGPTEINSPAQPVADRKSTRLKSSHASTSYPVFCPDKETYTDSTSVAKTQYDW